LLQSLKQRLEKRQKELSENFDDMIAKEFVRNDKYQLKSVNTQLEQITAYETHLKDVLAQEDADTIQLGRKQLAIQDLQDQLDLTKGIYETVRRRIQELEMERKRPARVSKAYYSSAAPLQDKRIKYTMALVFAAVASAVLLALLRDKFDMSLRTPEDVIRNVGVRIIGTTLNFDNIKKALPPQQFADDYQTICANLGLFNSHGIPKKLVVTSPCPKEGKTTLAVNLAVSLAKTSKKVLLIDGDLRKPDIAKSLKLSPGRGGLQEVLLGRKFEDVDRTTALNKLYVLSARTSKPSDIYKLMAQRSTYELIDRISENFDHVIIDSPPVLSVPDALLWAKMADAVVLTSFAGYTESRVLKETLERFEHINVDVLGTVLNNVSLSYRYNSYAYGYNANNDSFKNRRRGKKRKAVVLQVQEQ